MTPQTKTHTKRDIIFLINNSESCDAINQMVVITNIYLTSSSNIVQIKHVSFEICWHFKGIAQRTLHTKETLLHEMEDVNAKLHLKLNATILHIG